MDAQNATVADQSKSADASRRRASDADNKQPPKRSDRQPTASPEIKSVKLKATPSLNKPVVEAEADADEQDSDAETIVLPGKDGHSPSKIRKMRQDDSSNNGAEGSRGPKSSLGNGAGKTESDSKPNDGPRRRRFSASAPRDKTQVTRNKDGSSGLSSAPASPPRDGRSLHQRRRSNPSPHRSSDSEATANRAASSAKSAHDRLRSGDRLPSAKRKALRTDSEDEEDQHRKVRRQRTTSISVDSSRPQKERASESRNQSHSPPLRSHRRSTSTQLAQTSLGGLSQKKRRLPPPLQSTEQNSDDSDRSGSPPPRSSKLRSLATPVTVDSNVSPAKIMPHKKHLDAHGQTFLARACARGEYDAVKKRLAERPEDINVADYAGNTPLQIAAINGCEDIVKLLIDAGCNMDCVNYDKDTPLLDAVDNGHLGVVKLLLDAGVNPRKANVSGQEPIDRITDETENADEIRNLLMEARKRMGERRRTSEDRHSHPDSHDARDSHAPDSPRQSPAMALSGSTSRRGGTVRATKTRNDLLYMPLDDKTLRQAAGRGDEETVARILQVKEGCNDPESMVAAARGGHDLVMQLLLGLGSANPDPGPVPSLQPEFATPILAAIGQENIKVVELLLEQGGFDPTRRFKGETYYEIARKRQGTNWKEEETLLKNAYDEYKRTHREGVKQGKSPGRRERERDRDEKRLRRDEANRDDTRMHKRNASSPTRDGESRKKVGAQRVTSPRERRRLEPGRSTIKEDRNSSTHTSDRETSPAVSHKASKSKSRDTDAAVSSDGEALKPRRKLVSKGELRGEREKHRRSSMVSNASSLKEPSSPQDSRGEEPTSEKQKMSEKYHDRTKALKREESKDPSSMGNDGQAKRHRSSVTPDRPSHGDKDESSLPQKRRRLDPDGQEKRPKAPSSPETRHAKLSASRDNSKAPSKSGRKTTEDDMGKDGKDAQAKRDQTRKESSRSAVLETSVRVKSEDEDVHMPDVDNADVSAREQQDKKKRKDAVEQEDVKKEEEERKRAEARREEERRRADFEEKSRQQEEEAKRREAAEKARLEQEQQDRLEEQRRKKQEEEDRLKQEDERKRQEEEKKKQEEALRKQEEEERVRREQLEREAADARRKREEEQRKERERRERAQREELDRKRAAREAEQRRVREEQEKARLDKLPPLMRWLDLHPNPKTRAVAERFCQVQGCRYDTINPATNRTPEGREEWVLNTAVALLLGEKDLTLSRYSAWEHVPVSLLAKQTIWRTEWMKYSLATRQYFDIGREVPGLYPKEPEDLTPDEREELKKRAWERFRDLPMFFVKVSELLYTVPQIPHLHDVMIGVGYRELQEPEGSSPEFKVASKLFRYLAKHLSDPNMERYRGRTPRWRWYLNGNFVEEDLPKRAMTSNMPFNERPVPRRGLLAVNPDDPDYLKICREQGITPLVKGQPSPILTNGTHDNLTNTMAGPKVNGINGNSGALPSPEDPAKRSHDLNGVNGTS